MTFLPSNLYHTGYLVEDVDEAVERLGRIGITRWTPPKPHQLPIMVGDERQTARFRYSYSADGPHHIELIQPVGSTDYLVATGPMTFHHLGFWVDDLAAAVRESPDWGLSLECRYLNEDDSLKVTYHVDEAGLRYEMVPMSHKPVMEERWALARGEQPG